MLQCSDGVSVVLQCSDGVLCYSVVMVCCVPV